MRSQTPAVARELCRPTWRALPWSVLAGVGTVALLSVALPELLADPTPGVRLSLLRMAALTCALGIAFLLDDPGQVTTATVPVPRLVRHALRVLLVLPLHAVLWSALLAVAWIGAGESDRGQLPLGGVTVEAAAVSALAVALATVVARRDGTRPGTVAAPTLLLVTVPLAFLPAPLALVLPEGHPDWARVHALWAAICLAAAVASVVLALTPLGQYRHRPDNHRHASQTDQPLDRRPDPGRLR
ncbi:hypothetical protein AQ490_02970 [Wenjunlia vitaminophila]|uniref:ABC transporter n=1 Tax=Wenjunlia vitaminophila TaxID=76728 RepID=A0A0T6LYS8_WENVI|nr:hypothetical protein [Wenjunlia vitaminophila]KRV51165.1 hypothetical protein AQ490_02970 [Wenjunlia vitaminophila]